MRIYVQRVFKFVFRGFAIRTDVWYAIISIAVSALTGAADKPVDEITTHDLAWYFLTAVGVYLFLRVLAAPYYLWKEDQLTITDLRTALSAPFRQEYAAIGEHRAELRKRLLGVVAQATVKTSLQAIDGTLKRDQEVEEIGTILEILAVLSQDQEVVDSSRKYFDAWIALVAADDDDRKAKRLEFAHTSEEFPNAIALIKLNASPV